MYDLQEVFSRICQRSSKHEEHEVGKIEKAGYTLIPD
jgi:hypothetical protein